MNKIATFTNEVYQNAIEEKDLEFIATSHQAYFELETECGKCLVGLDTILECILVAEKAEQIPKLGNSFWQQIEERYGINWYNYSINYDK
ncbi:hypothetical protein SAMN04487830_10612 [Pseudobutyrivibrio sp. OR37]|uniref:hypothetical protein n=1 Tax=Pseudobutyrivibrio sp. OR37 TaxID=1798186 RepID=UPI0008EFCF84|nr:hypothetical protein [Pseudobutyrivibrio sp. OR37]SFH70876.1 hypothetical protein SAMN04487830_10612 [Pseudobutyrivibrio sp. OR37]